jgi:outer membrane lipoprotein SlyB
MEAQVEKIDGTKVTIRLGNGETRVVDKKEMPRCLKADEILTFEEGRYFRAPSSKAKKSC